MDLDVVHRFISEESYWARGRSRDAQTRANEASTCFASYTTRLATGPLRCDAARRRFLRLGCRRLRTVAHRGERCGVFLMRCVADAFPDLARLVLGTRDAHGLYAKVGFSPIIRVDRWMERWQEEPNP